MCRKCLLWHYLPPGGERGDDVVAAILVGGQTMHSKPGPGIPESSESFKNMWAHKKYWRHVKTLVLDEGDRLLDEGFERQLTQIVAASSRSRQTLCFSATMPADLDRMLRSGAVKRDHARLDATGLGSTVADATAARVELSRLSLPRGADALGALANALNAHRGGKGGSKVVVFCPTTASAELAAAYLHRRGLDNAALHSRKTQSYRTRVSNAFRDADASSDHAILVATDVAARGVDYPGVSLVVQLGAPDSREQFVHRAGRTGRVSFGVCYHLVSSNLLNRCRAYDAPHVQAAPLDQVVLGLRGSLPHSLAAPLLREFPSPPSEAQIADAFGLLEKRGLLEVRAAPPKHALPTDVIDAYDGTPLTPAGRLAASLPVCRRKYTSP